MMNRMKVFAADSVEAMAKITRELGSEARIYSTRRVNGGIEIIAGMGEDDDDDAADAMQRGLRPNPKTKAQADFASLLASAREVARYGDRIQRTPDGTPERADPSAPVFDESRIIAIENTVSEIKSMLSCGLMTHALAAAGASPELIAIFLAQSGAYEQENADKKFGAFLAKRLTYPDAGALLSIPRVIVTLGPSGVGKTTLLAQMIARLRMNEPNARVTLVNAHSNRFGAAEDLRAYGRILDTPTIDIEHPDELSDFIKSIDQRIYVFVDMPSAPDECARISDVLEENADYLAPITRIGVVPANLSREAALGILDRYKNLEAIAITKLSEGAPTASMLGQLSLRNAKIAFLSSTSHLTRGLSEPGAEDLDQLIRGALLPAAPAEV
jgi:flagellar biosynthesis protein FlhF